MSGRWSVTVNWIETVYDGKGDHQRAREVVVADPPALYDTQDQAEAAAARIRAMRSTGRDRQEVCVSGPPDRHGATHLDENTRAAGLAGIRAMRAQLGGRS